MKPYLIPFFATVALTATAQQKNEITSVLEILDVTNGNRTVVKEFPYRIEAPNWTPDGQWLLYNSEGKLYRLSPTSPAEPELINTGFAQNCNNDHVLSTDGQQIAISHGTKEDYKSRIYTLPITGGTPRLITPMAPSYLHGWSPDGKELAYCAERNGNYDVYTIPAEGGEETRLTTAEGLDDGPEYSPCGQYIWFNSVRTGLMQVWRMKADGSEQTQMTFDETRNSWFPHISPDGKSVVFITYYKGDLEPGDKVFPHRHGPVRPGRHPIGHIQRTGIQQQCQLPVQCTPWSAVCCREFHLHLYGILLPAGCKCGTSRCATRQLALAVQNRYAVTPRIGAQNGISVFVEIVTGVLTSPQICQKKDTVPLIDKVSHVFMIVRFSIVASLAGQLHSRAGACNTPLGIGQQTEITRRRCSCITGR